MKPISKFGTGILISGIILSVIGGTVCALTTGFNFMPDLGEPFSYEKTVNEKINEINIDVSFSNFEIKKGKKLKIVAEDVPEKLEFDINIDADNKKMSVKNKNDFSSYLSLNKKNINFYNFSDEKSMGKYTIYVPENKLDEINISVSFSDIECSDLNADKINITSSFGEFNFDNIECDELGIASSFGYCGLNEIKCDEAVMENSFGEYVADNLKITSSGDLNNSFGDMNINLLGKNYNISGNNFLGSSDMSVKKSSEGVKIKYNSSFGSINFEN